MLQSGAKDRYAALECLAKLATFTYELVHPYKDAVLRKILLVLDERKCPCVPDDVKANFATVGPKLSVKVESVAKTDVATTGTLPPSTSVNPVAVTPEGSSAAMATSSPCTTLQSRKQKDMWGVLLFEENSRRRWSLPHAPWALLDTSDFGAAMELVHPASDPLSSPLTATLARTHVLSRLALKYDRECTDFLARSTAVTLVVTNVVDSGTKGTKKTTYVAVTESPRAFVLAQSSDMTILLLALPFN
ncbi:hypothetical protein PsorP6_010610 [Peronosclerospora sorghi]|uniref:Uncharacterized protein n=1 Tax=Peronosclerospora sorghi TaxID=230839 RepID=A0ACC0VVW6_9STRA|nr:hypothetical protein PsorP6_010610 [Peronosclerospora sorghi]